MSGLDDFLKKSSPEEVFEWLIAPITVSEFFADYWQKKPLLISRNAAGYYRDFLTRRAVVEQLQSKRGLRNGTDLNVARYVDGEQVMETGKPEGARADPRHALSRFNSGSSWQAVHPQRYHRATRLLLSKLEAALGCVCGSNSFITPKGAQGFKPHHDEVEVFLLQLEGSKHWRLHAGHQLWPTTYKWDYPRSVIAEPVLLDATLQPGDLLYFPRGTVHYATATDGCALSHHLTISSYQKNTWGELVRAAVPAALERAMESDPRYREGVPIRWQRSAGDGLPGTDSRGRDHLRELMHDLVDQIDFDNLADTLACKLVAARLPPVPSNSAAEVRAGAHVRWTDPLAVRVVVDEAEDGPETQIYHSFQNRPEQHLDPTAPPAAPECFVVPGAQHAPALLALGSTWPRWTRVPDDAAEEWLELLDGLRENGLLEVAVAGQAARPSPLDAAADQLMANVGQVPGTALPAVTVQHKAPSASPKKQKSRGVRRSVRKA